MSLFRSRVHILWWIVAGAILLRLLLVGILWSDQNPDFFVYGDSHGYLRIAENLAAGNGFSQLSAPPYLPDSERTILYPLIISVSLFLFHSYIPLILLQVVCAGLIVWFTYEICKMATGSEKLSLIAALLITVEPYSVFINTQLLTETIFSTFLLGGVYFCMRYLGGDRALHLALASVFFGLAALTRPIGEFLPVVLIAVVLIAETPRAYIKYGLIAVVPFLIVVSPWLVRNRIEFGVAALSSSGFQNVYSDLGGAILSYHDHISSDQAKNELETSYEQTHSVDPSDIQRNLAYAPSLFGDGIKIMAAYPLDTIKVFTSITLTFFTNDAWVYYPQVWGWLPKYGTLAFSPSYTLMTEGPIITFQKIMAIGGATLPFAIAGRLFWVIISALALIGVASLVLRGGLARSYGLFFAIVVLYLLALSSSVGFGINGRFRYPVDPLFFTTAMIGAALLSRYKRRLFHRA